MMSWDGVVSSQVILTSFVTVPPAELAIAPHHPQHTRLAFLTPGGHGQDRARFGRPSLCEHAVERPAGEALDAFGANQPEGLLLEDELTDRLVGLIREAAQANPVLARCGARSEDGQTPFAIDFRVRSKTPPVCIPCCSKG